MSDGTPPEPPGQRRVVVLREGPPRGRGRTLDGVLGAVGAVLLLGAVLLVSVLPEQTVPDPQYRVEYGDELEEKIGSVRSDALPGAPAGGVITPGRDNALASAYDIEHNNVYEVTVEVFFEDDFPESLPDVLRWELFYPNGTSAGISSEYETLETAEVDAGAGVGVGASYETVGTGTYKATFNLGGKPQDTIVTFEDGNGTLEEATQAVVLADTRATQGTWTVEVWLESVGQCPPPQPGTDSDRIRHAQICQLAAQQRGGDDAGNGFTLSKFEYRYYTIQVSEA